MPKARTIAPANIGLQSLMETARTLCSVFQPEADQDFVRYALDNAAIVATTDVHGTITYVNGKFCQISGYTETELVGSNHRMLKSGEHDRTFFKTMYRQIARGEIWHGEICNRRKDGSLYWVYTTIVPHLSTRGKLDSYTSIRFDITARKQLEAELRTSKEHLKRIANLDPLTGLPNRRFFQEHIQTLVDDHASRGRKFHLALLDIDSFKEVNDSFGHHAGDHLLLTVAARLGALTPSVFISRLGGDEFGLLLTDTPAPDATAFFETVLESIREPIQIGVTPRRCSASLGIAVFPRDGRDAEELFKAADLALYHAKALGRDRLEIFQLRLKEVAERLSELLIEIEDGLRQDAFELHYQPIVPVSVDRLPSLEALMRWRHPTKGLLSPGAFQDGFADPAVRAALGLFMLERVFHDMADFADRCVPIGRIAINLTNSDFRSETFIQRFFSLSEQTGIGPDRFCIEVTEGMLFGSNHKRVEEGLRRFHDAGVEIALDDFGTGYASLSHLRQLPLDRLKIDRSFVANMVTSPEDRAIVRGVIEIAHSLGKLVTAEGVETVDQVDLLLQMDCDHLQGWYFSKATPPAGLLKVFETMPSAGYQVVGALQHTR